MAWHRKQDSTQVDGTNKEEQEDGIEDLWSIGPRRLEYRDNHWLRCSKVMLRLLVGGRPFSRRVDTSSKA